jgi:hypothetical protein
MENDCLQKAKLQTVLVGLLLCLGLSGVILIEYSWAQSGRIPKIEGGRFHYSTLYKPGAVEKIPGKVVSLGKTWSGNGRAFCENLILKTSRGNIWVILKPESYRPKNTLTIHPADQLEITGSRIMLPGKSALIAALVKKGNATMVLRDVQTGRPAWAVGDNWHIQ